MKPSALALLVAIASGPALAAEQPVAPYPQSDANAGAAPFKDDRVFQALHGKAGVARITADLIERLKTDSRTSDIFRAADFERLDRTLNEEFCYVAGGPCHYSGMDMKTAHKHMGLQEIHFNALVEDLEAAMTKEGVPWRVQARLLAKFATMKPEVVDASRN
ncbi:MAG TPA: group 1 truncated hemoglobin [Caulobacteraceae bacterium]|jgi:hemoglobin